MRRLHLLRHAKSAWDDQTVEDHDRPLAPRGRRAARDIARHFRRLGADPDLVLCSTALRARETLDAVLPGFARTPLVTIERGLYLAAPETVLARLREVEARVACIVVIGHNPGLHELALTLATHGSAKLASSVARKFPTGALATYEVDAPWEEIEPENCRLSAYVIPADLEVG